MTIMYAAAAEQQAAPAGADDQIVPSVSVHIKPCHTGAALAEFAREQGLAGKVVERILMVAVV